MRGRVASRRQVWRAVVAATRSTRGASRA